MHQRTRFTTLLVLFNLPWLGLWWYFSAPDRQRGLGVLALYMILVICTLSMVLLPLLLGGVARKRWLLILILGLTNLFWALKWIEIFSSTAPMDSAYAAARHAIARLMLLSSLVVVILYQLADRLLSRARNS